MSTPTSLSPDQRALLNRAFLAGSRLSGGRFEVADVDGQADLWQAAELYARTCDAAWSDWLSERQRRVQLGTFLTAGEVKGVLNCLMADGRRRREAAARVSQPAELAPSAPAAAPLADLPLGTFTVVLPGGDYATIRLVEWEDYRDRSTGLPIAGVRAARYLAGPDNSTDFVYFARVMPDGRVFAKAGFDRQRLALDVVLRGDNLAELGLAYALRSSRCFVCGRVLTVPASIHSGMGPDCAAKHGREYGPPPAPAVAEAMTGVESPSEDHQEAPLAPALPVAAPAPAVAERAPEEPAAGARVPYGAPGRAAWLKSALGLDDLITDAEAAEVAA